MFRQFIIVSILSFWFTSLYAQGELNATVRVNTPQLQKNDRKVFDQLETALRDFLNNNRWTGDNFEPEERIKCSFILTISNELDNNAFQGELAVQSTRPVYGSGYETALLNYLDKDIQFTYEQNQPIEFIKDATDNQNLAAVFAYYAYIILGMDYDSFSQYGGEPHFSNAEKLVSSIQNSSSNGATGWRPGDGGKNRNRYWLIENLLSPRVKPYRGAMYNYYRNGLDVMTTNPDQAKTSVLQALEDIDKVSVAYLNSMIIQLFAYSKKDELVEMWKVAPKAQKDRVIQIMTRVDPANGQRYREIGS